MIFGGPVPSHSPHGPKDAPDMYQPLCSVYALLAVYHHLFQAFADLQNKKIEILN